MRNGLATFVIASMVVFVVMGCATIKRSTDYYQACRNDEACYAEMVKYGNMSSAVTGAVAKTFKLDDLLMQIAFNLGSGLSGIILGRKLCKKR